MALPSRAVRVLRVIARLNVGGPARHAVLLDSGLRQRGFDTLLAYGASSRAEGTMEDLAHSRKLPVRYIATLGRAIKAGDDLRAFRQILALMRTFRPDVVHTHTAKAGTLGRIAAAAYNATRPRRSQCATVHTFHGHVLEQYFGPFGSGAARIIERTLAHATDRIVTISDRQRHDIVERFRVARQDRVEVVPLGLDLDDLLRPADGVALRAELGIPSTDFVIGFVGRLVPIKRVDVLLGAFASARAHCPSLRLLVAGDGEQRGCLERLSAELKLGTAAQFLGWRRDLRELYASMDLFALTSANEGTPVALIEALASGVPVVASSVGGVPDVFEANASGKLLPVCDAASVAAAFLDAARAPRTRQPESVRRRTVARFGTERLVDDIVHVYDAALRRRRRASIQ